MGKEDVDMTRRICCSRSQGSLMGMEELEMT